MKNNKNEHTAFFGKKFIIDAFKPKPHRFLCFFFAEKKIIVTNAFHKKTDKLPKNEKNKAIKMREDYEARIQRGKYYE